jgi:hypothetical protein
VWTFYKDDRKRDPTRWLKIARTYFYATWKKYRPQCKLRKHHRFAVCTICKEAQVHACFLNFLTFQIPQDKILAIRGDAAAVRREQTKFAAHVEEVKAQRLAYRTRQELARDDKQKYLSLVIDGVMKHTNICAHYHTYCAQERTRAFTICPVINIW